MKFLLVLLIVGTVNGGVSSEKIAVYDTSAQCEQSGKSFVDSYNNSQGFRGIDRVRYSCGSVTDAVIGSSK